MLRSQVFRDRSRSRPDGRVERFQPIVSFSRGGSNTCAMVTTTNAWLRFVPMGGTRGKLEVLALADYSGEVDEVTIDNGSGVLYAGHASMEPVYDPIAYRLTTQDGTIYEFGRVASEPHQVFELERIEDRNGNVLEFTATGIVSSSGPEVIIHRVGGDDSPIDYIEDPSGAHVEYAYDTTAELDRLWKVFDRAHSADEDAWTQFT